VKNLCVRSGFVLLASLICITSCSKKEDPVPTPEGLFINEIYSTGNDWIELYNDLNETKDISGYFIYDDVLSKYKLPQGTTVPAKGFLVLNCNGLGTGLNTNYKLSSSGEVVYLENADGKLIDKVEFPAMVDGQSYGRYPDGSALLTISGVVTKGSSNGDSVTPTVSEVTQTPLVVGLNENVTVVASVPVTSVVASIKLYYRLNNGTYTSTSMTQSGNNYSAMVLGFSSTGKVEYYVEVTGQNGKASYYPSNAPTETLSFLLNTDTLPELVINELMAVNGTCCADTDSGSPEYDDWIEIYNKGMVSVNVGGMYVSDNKASPFKYKLPDDNPTATTIAPGGYLLLWADNSPDQGPLHVDFALSGAGEDVGIYYIDGRTIDEYTFGTQTQDISYGRTTDGAATWKSFATPTPGKSNQ
jgi:hypothetical protein